MVGEETAFSSSQVQVGGIPAITTHHHSGHALFLGLGANQVDDVVVIGQEENFGLALGNLGQDGGEVGILSWCRFPCRRSVPPASVKAFSKASARPRT